MNNRLFIQLQLLKYFQVFSLALFLSAGSGFASPTDSINQHRIPLPNTLATHPLGLFITRIPYHFKAEATEKWTVAVSLSNGNVWLPYVKAYIPKNEVDREFLSTYKWHQREGVFDASSMPHNRYTLHADGIFRVYHLRVGMPLGKNRDLEFALRAFTIDGGTPPWALLVSDEFIEWFHTHIHGGEDPFARKVYGYHFAEVNYRDENGKFLTLDEETFIAPGGYIRFNHYPQWQALLQRNYFLSVSIMLGLNTSRYNAGADLGISATLLKEFSWRRNGFDLGLGVGTIKNQLVNFNDPLVVGTNKLLYSCELLTGYTRYLKSGHRITLSTNMHMQSAFRDKDEARHLVMTGDRISTHWNYAASHLYRPLLAHSFIMSYAWKHLSLSLVAREDFLVDNAPDAQSGIEIKYLF